MRKEIFIAERGYKIDGASVALINKSVEELDKEIRHNGKNIKIEPEK